jgi:hypothetical protein
MWDAQKISLLLSSMTYSKCFCQRGENRIKYFLRWYCWTLSRQFFWSKKIYKVAWNKSLLIELFVFEYSEFFIEFFDKKSLCLNVYSCYLKCSIQNEVCSCESEEDDGENSFVHFSVRILRLNLQFRETRTSQTATRFWIG